MKFAEIKLLLVFREWLLLKDFEKLDMDLTSKLNLKAFEKKEIDQKVLLIAIATTTTEFPLLI